MTLFEIFLLGCGGVFAGFINVIAGGGSMISIPLMIFFGLPGNVANGTNRIAIISQNISAVIAFRKKGFSDLKLSLSLAMFTLPGAVIGAYSASTFKGQNFDYFLAAVMIIVILLMSFGGVKESTQAQIKPTRTRLILTHIGMIFIGFWGGFIQIGVGFLIIPLLHRVLGIDLVRTNSHKVFIALIFSIVALIVFSSQIELFWLAGIGLAVGTAIGGWIGTNFQVTKGVGVIKWMLNIVIIIFIIKLLFL